MIVAGLEQRFDFVERRQGAIALPGLVEIGGQGLADVGENPALVADDSEELVPPVGGRVGILGEDLRSRTDRGDPGQHPMHRFDQERVVGHPVRQRLNLHGRGALGARQRPQRARPAGVAADQFARTRLLDTERGDVRSGGNLVQGLEQPPLGGVVEFVEPEFERRGGPAQQRAGDPALVALDQVEVRRRNPYAPGHFGLRHAHGAAALPDARSQNGLRHLLAPLSAHICKV